MKETVTIILLDTKEKKIGFTKDYSLISYNYTTQNVKELISSSIQKDFKITSNLFVNCEVDKINNNHIFISIFDEGDKDNLIWLNIKDIKDTLLLDYLKVIESIFDNDGKISAAILTDLGLCPTCYNKENNNILYGDNSCNMLYENDILECFFVGNPRADGHVAISSKKHYKDMMEIPDDLCSEIYIFAKKVMNILKDVFEAESVYLCTMCDGKMNHFHVQLIPRYSYEKRGSKNFVKPRKSYVEDTEKLNKIRRLLK